MYHVCAPELAGFQIMVILDLCYVQSYEIKSPPWTIWWFRILGISLLKIKIGWVLWCFKLQTIVSCALIYSTLLSSWLLSEVWYIIATQPILIFFRARVLHLDRLKEWTWLYSFAKNKHSWITRQRTMRVTSFMKLNLHIFNPKVLTRDLNFGTKYRSKYGPCYK